MRAAAPRLGELKPQRLRVGGVVVEQGRLPRQLRLHGGRHGEALHRLERGGEGARQRIPRVQHPRRPLAPFLVRPHALAPAAAGRVGAAAAAAARHAARAGSGAGGEAAERLTVGEKALPRLRASAADGLLQTVQIPREDLDLREQRTALALHRGALLLHGRLAPLRLLL